MAETSINFSRYLPAAWREHIAPLGVLTALLLVLVWPAMGPGIWLGHELYFPIVRMQLMVDLWLVHGPFHTPWTPEAFFGYGWPFFTFYAPFGYYVGSAAMLLTGMSALAATRLSFFLSLFVGAYLVYGFLLAIGPGTEEAGHDRRRWWAFTGALIHAVAPYHLADIFSRTALAESWAFALVPALFWAVEYSRRQAANGMLAIAVAYGALVLSHNITAMYATIFVGIYTLITCERSWRFVARVMAGGAWGAALTAYFWLPALQLVKLVSAGKEGMMHNAPEKLAGQALSLRELLMESQALGTTTNVFDRVLGTNLGYGVIVATILSAIAIKWLSGGRRLTVVAFLVLMFICCVMMSTLMPWNMTPSYLRFIQFPWRLLLFTTLFGCAAMMVAAPVINRWLHPLVIGGPTALLAIALFSSTTLTMDTGSRTQAEIDAWYRNEELKGLYMGSIHMEYAPLAAVALVDPKFHVANPPPESRISTIEGDFVAVDHAREGTRYTWSYESRAGAMVRVHLLDFPGWEFLLNNVPAPDALGSDGRGMLTLRLPAGKHSAELQYVLSPIGRMARMISITAWLLAACFPLARLRRFRRRDVEQAS